MKNHRTTRRKTAQDWPKKCLVLLKKGVLPGRELLSRFAGKWAKIEYSKFRNLIVGEMREKGRIPDEVKVTIDKIPS